MRKKYFIGFFIVLSHYIVFSQCPSNIHITGMVSSPNIIEKQASATVNAFGTINNGAGAIYRSGNDIFLNDGFNAKNGSIFNAYIGNCTDSVCKLPKNVTALVNSDSSISLSWSFDPPTSNTSWRIRIVRESDNQIEKDIVYNGSSPYIVPPGELSSGENYTFKINPICEPIASINFVQSARFKVPLYKELLWNHRLKLRNWQHLNQYDNVNPTTNQDPEYYTYCPINDFTDKITRPKANETLKCYYPNSSQTTTTNTIDNTGSVILITANYKNSTYITDSPLNQIGFKFDIPATTTNDNCIEFNTYNQMLTSTIDYERLHEVGLLFWHWGDVSAGNMTENSGKWSFKRSFTLGEFENSIIVSFKAKINKSDLDVNTPNSNSYLTADLRFQYYNGATMVHSGLVGVLFYENNDYPKENPIYWSSYDDIKKDYRLLIRGSSKNIKECNYEYQDITINYKDFINQLPVPAGLSYDKVIIKGLDIYSHVRGKSDLNFSIKDVKLIGLLPSANSINKTANPANENILNTKTGQKFIKISPNPNNGVFKILFNSPIESMITVSDASGKIIYNKNFPKQKEAEVVLPNNIKGIFFVNVQLGNQTYKEQVIIK